MPGSALRTRSPTVRAHVRGESGVQCKMGEELPILKGILNGVVNYHNARRCLVIFCRALTVPIISSRRAVYFLFETRLTYITFHRVKVTHSPFSGAKRCSVCTWTLFRKLSGTFTTQLAHEGNGQQMQSSWHASDTWSPSRVRALATSLN